MKKVKIFAITMGITFAIFFAAIGSLLISNAIIESAQYETIEISTNGNLNAINDHYYRQV